MRYAIIALSLLTSLSFAQESLISALDSIEENVIGFALNGNAKAGAAGSILDTKALASGEDASEYSAFTDFTLGISVRPSNETKATFDLRFHKDWQSAFREGNNSPIIRWWSYDGNLFDKKLKFNLGTMRVAYTPLTIYLPEPDVIMEPEIFSELRNDAMKERYLDGTSRRLLQGLNLEYATSAGVLDKIFLQGTIVRLRKVADGTDRIYYDFDPNKDRYSTAARAGLEAMGLSFGVNEVYTFNRFSSSMKNPRFDSIVDYEKNNVLSFELNYNSKKLLSGPISFGAGVEYALSGWEHWQHKRDSADAEKYLDFFRLDEDPSKDVPSITSPSGKSNFYPYYKTERPKSYIYKLSEIEEVKSKSALLGNAFVSYDENPFEAKLSGHFLKTDKDFESELAASPAYLPNLPILNSDADLGRLGPLLESFRTGTLENMYYSLYYTLPFNAATIVSGPQGRASEVICLKNSNLSKFSFYQAACLDNNYKFAQYYRNAYTQQTFTRLERSKVSFLDPSVNMALPNGYATPDRSGGDVDFKFTWNKAISVRGVFGTYSSDLSDYKRFGGGADVNIARLIGLNTALSVSGSYEQNKEENGEWNPQTNRIIAGFKVGIWNRLYLLGGVQQLTKEFGNPVLLEDNFTINNTKELLALGGPQIKISEKANFTLQGGLLSNSVSFKDNGAEGEVTLDKLIVSGMVTVDF